MTRTSWRSAATNSPPTTTSIPVPRERIWGDLCRGPHIPTTKYIPAFKLTRSSAAYWRGDQNNASLQRVYGTAWESQEALDRHLELIEEAQRRDHRKLGAELDLFSFPDELGSSFTRFFIPRAAFCARSWRTTSRQKHVEAATSSSTPRTSPKEHLYVTSGPPGWYADGMFPPMHIDAEYADGELCCNRGRTTTTQTDELPDAPPDLPSRAGPTANCRCGSSNSARCTGTRSPASYTA